jgi:precorrin-6B methylase 2
MITTLDKIKAKKGQHVWEIGITTKGVYAPTASTVHSKTNPITNPERCWKSYELCQKECDKLNSKTK